ncbi:type II toxin-antitoxin system VapB family antitoxin [Brucella intermedia]|nr:type II toxin-antitoxin system VapB family antitoxin [Brucella intermedia]
MTKPTRIPKARTTQRSVPKRLNKPQAGHALLPHDRFPVANVEKSIYIKVTIYLHGVPAMAINVTNETADQLTRKFAKIAMVSISDAIVIAMREAIERRLNVETPAQTAARLREKYHVADKEAAKKPLPKAAYDEMWDA